MAGGLISAGIKARYEPREEVVTFSQDMERKLRSNEHKGGWQDCSVVFLVNKAQEELDELKAIILGIHQGQLPSNYFGLVDEAADVANMVMMIADNARKGRVKI